MGPTAKKVLIVSVVLVVLAAIVGIIVYSTTADDTPAAAATTPAATTTATTPATTTVAASSAAPVAAPKPVTYSALANMDHFGDDLAGSPFATVEATKAFCDSNPQCKGYNNNRYAKSNVSSPISSNGMTLFQKQ